MAAQDKVDEAANFVQKLGQADFSSLFAFFESGIGAYIWFFVKIIVYVAIAVFGALAIYKFYLQYNIRVEIWRETAGGGREVKQDRAKIVRDDQGKRKLELMKTRDAGYKATMPLPGAKYRLKDGKKDKYYLWIDDNMQLHPIYPPASQTMSGDKQFSIRPQERDAWARLESKQQEQKFHQQSTWKEMMPYIMYATTGLIVFLVWFFAVRELGAGMAEMTSAFRQVAASCTKLGG